MKQFPDLAQNYKIQLGYFKKTFYKNAHGREETEKYLALAQKYNLKDETPKNRYVAKSKKTKEVEANSSDTILPPPDLTTNA